MYLITDRVKFKTEKAVPSVDHELQRKTFGCNYHVLTKEGSIDIGMCNF